MRMTVLILMAVCCQLSVWYASPALSQEKSTPKEVAEITFYLPPVAKLVVQKEEQRVMGSMVRLITPPLKLGAAYHYNVMAVWRENGTETRIERRVSMRAGQKRLVNMYGNSLQDITNEVVTETNRQRAAHGVSPLTSNPQLAAAAQKHADNMAKQRMLSHTLNGQGFLERATSEGYPFSAGGENIAEGAFSSWDVVGMWMRSPGHRANMLSRDYTEIGIGTAWDSQGRRFDVQVFGHPAE